MVKLTVIVQGGLLLELNKERSLQFLLDVAYSRGISQNQLCKDICDSSNFSKMCTGKRQITTDIILKLTHRLNISFENLLLYSSTESPLEYKKMVRQFYRAKKNNDIKTIDQLYKDNVDIYSDSDPLFLWMKALIELSVNDNSLYSIDLLKKAILVSCPLFSFENLNFEVFKKIDFEIFLDLILFYAAHEEIYLKPSQYQLDYPITVCKIIIDQYVTELIEQDLSLYPTYCSMLVSLYRMLDNLLLAYPYIEKGLEFCKEEALLSLIPSFYLHLVVYEKGQNNEEIALMYFYESLYLLKLQNKEPEFYKNFHYFINKHQLNITPELVTKYLPIPLNKKM